MKKIISLLLLICLVQSAHAQLLWKISGNGLEKPSYVFGTYHLAPLGIKDSIAALPQAMNETTQVYGEVVMSEMMSPAFMQSMQQQMMMPKDSTLQSLFTPEQYEEVGKVVKENMMADIAMLAQLKPAAISQQLTVILYMRHTPGFNPQEQLDNYFQQQAQQQGKKVGGLETVQSQIDILFNSQTLKRQAELLHCMAHDIDRTVGQVKRVIAAYQKQDLKIVLQLLAERHGDACDPLPGEMEALIDNRNKAWAEKMPAIMSEAPTLFVVGAGHLPGDNGLLNLLQQQGYTLEDLK